MRLTRRASWACVVVRLSSRTNAQNAVLYRLFMWAIRVRSPTPQGQHKKRVLTVGLPPREVISDHLLCRIQDNPSVERRRVLQAHSWEMFCPVEHIRRRKLGHDGRQYFRLSSVAKAGRFFEQEAGRIMRFSHGYTSPLRPK